MMLVEVGSMRIEAFRTREANSEGETSRVVVVTPGELREVVRDALLDVLAHARAEQTGIRQTGEWLDSRAVANLLGVCTRTVVHLARREELPSSRVGRLLRFQRADVDAFVAARRTG